MRQLDSDREALKQVRLPWWGVLLWMGLCALIVWLLNGVGKFDLARPALYSIGMLAIAVSLKWKLRRHVWFWTAAMAFVILHLLLVLLVPWTAHWIPAVLVIPLGVLDLYAMLAVFGFVGRLSDQKSTKA